MQGFPTDLMLLKYELVAKVILFK